MIKTKKKLLTKTWNNKVYYGANNNNPSQLIDLIHNSFQAYGKIYFKPILLLYQKETEDKFSIKQRKRKETFEDFDFYEQDMKTKVVAIWWQFINKFLCFIQTDRQIEWFIKQLHS